MSKRTLQRIAGVAVHPPAPLLVIGVRAGDALGLFLSKTFGGAVRFLPHAPGPGKRRSADFAIGVFSTPDNKEVQSFAAWAMETGIPALIVKPGLSGTLIGPLSLPHKAGCSYCEWRRIAAASLEDLFRTSPVAAQRNIPAVARQALAREVKAIRRRGTGHSGLLDHVLAIDTSSRSSSLHRVIPLPFCKVCGGAAALPPARQNPRLSPEDPPETVLDALAGWVDPCTGVICRLLLDSPEETGVELPVVATAAPPRLMEDDGSFESMPIGWGKGLNVSQAILSAVGEAVERYSASLPDPARIVWERPADLEGEFLDPENFALYSDAQYQKEGFPYAPFDRSVLHPWIGGRWLSSNLPVWVPAIFVFLSLTLHQEHLICQGTSNGIATATDPEEAALRATLELVERDAFMVAWLTASAGTRVEIDGSLDPLLRSVLEGIKGLGAAVEVYILNTGACGTTALCLALGDGRAYPGVTLGLGTDLDPLIALRQSILELGQTGPHLRRMMRSNTVPVPDDPQSVQDMLHHAAYYFPAERAREFDRLRSSEAPLMLRDLVKAAQTAPNRSLASCALQLETAEIRVALVDVTSPDVATGPFHVVRAVSPDLQPISYGYGFDRSPVKRIQLRGLASCVPAIHPIW